MRSVSKIFVFACLSVGTSAMAADLGLATKFNAFIFGNAATTGGHSSGSIAVGGNWSLGYEAKQDPFPGVPYPDLPSAPQAGIYVGGNVTASGVARVLRGNAYVGGAVAGTLDVQNGFALHQGAAFVDPTVFTAQKSYSLAQSAAIGAMNGVTLSVPDPNVLNINLNTNNLNGDQKVYFIDASKLSTNTAVNITGGNANTTVLINVLGASANWSWQVNTSLANRLLWNFVDATSLQINRQFDGSILAPNAQVHQQLGNINGTLIANGWTNANSQELHSFMFQGNAPVPEPATIGVIGLGLAALLRRRRKN